jgi:DNA-binding GntR family transcriptional regulator
MSAQPRSLQLWRPMSPARATSRAGRDGGGLAVYDRLKERLLMCPPVPGRTMHVKLLAEELGVSTTPVREALTRLAAERLLVTSRHRGFFVEVPTAQGIRDLYWANEAVLCAALDRWPECTPEMSEEAATAATRLARAGTDADALARAIAGLFVLIAARSGIDELVQIVRNLGDRLHRVRCIECALIADVREDVAAFAAALVQQSRDDVRTSIRSYHGRRHALAAALCRELVIASYFPTRRLPDSP